MSEVRNETTSSKFDVEIGFLKVGYGTTTSTTTIKEDPPQVAGGNPVAAVGVTTSGNGSSELLDFYRNKIPAQPSGVYIQTILKQWKNDFKKLDEFDNYLQWLFPNRVPGRNPQAPLITDIDAREFQSSRDLELTAMESFQMMLSFFGMELQGCGRIVLASNHKERIKVYSHVKYYYIITRILLFLKELNKNQLMVAWLTVFADLIQNKKLNYEAKTSYNQYWINTLENWDKEKINHYIETLNN